MCAGAIAVGVLASSDGVDSLAFGGRRVLKISKVEPCALSQKTSSLVLIEGNFADAQVASPACHFAVHLDSSHFDKTAAMNQTTTGLDVQVGGVANGNAVSCPSPTAALWDGNQTWTTVSVRRNDAEGWTVAQAFVPLVTDLHESGELH
jgi:hypothetical protein